MKNLKDAKNFYNNIEIPKDLEKITNNILQSDTKRRKIIMLKNYVKYACAFIGVGVLIIGVGVNTSPTIANNLSKIPIIGKVISVISINDFEKDEDKTININQPNIVNNNTTEKNFITDINLEIDRIINEYKENANKSIEEYKRAFLETGGTEEEFKAKNIKVDVNYEVKSETENTLSLVLYAYENWNSSSNVTYYYNIDLNTGENITLKDILGDNYINIVNQSVDNQIKERIKTNPNDIFFGYNETDINYKFESITPEQKFYINQNSNPVIVFDKYEIAPGYMGQIEFEISK